MSLLLSQFLNLTFLPDLQLVFDFFFDKIKLNGILAMIFELYVEIGSKHVSHYLITILTYLGRADAQEPRYEFFTDIVVIQHWCQKPYITCFFVT